MPVSTASVISTPCGFILGVDESEPSVKFTTDVHEAMIFFTIEEAEMFISRFADNGYGLNSGQYTIEAINVEDVDVD